MRAWELATGRSCYEYINAVLQCTFLTETLRHPSLAHLVIHYSREDDDEMHVQVQIAMHLAPVLCVVLQRSVLTGESSSSSAGDAAQVAKKPKK